MENAGPGASVASVDGQNTAADPTATLSVGADGTNGAAEDVSAATISAKASGPASAALACGVAEGSAAGAAPGVRVAKKLGSREAEDGKSCM